MLQYDKIDVSEGIDINKTRESKKYMLFHYWYFIDIAYKFQPYVCNACHVVSMIAYELKKALIIGVFYGVLVKMTW